jgi:two-component system response regulator DegU
MVPHEKLNALVVDDSPLFRNNILHIVREHSQIGACYEANNLDVLNSFLASGKIYYVFLEIQMQKMDGSLIADIIRKQYPDIHLIIISNVNAKKQVIEIMQKGIKGYILKTSSKTEISNAIGDIVGGSIFYAAEIAKLWSEYLMIQSSNGYGKINYKTEITMREKEIIVLICDGLTTSQIALKLNISYTTVNNHRAHIMKKLDIDNVVGIVLYAVRKGIYIQ